MPTEVPLGAEGLSLHPFQMQYVFIYQALLEHYLYGDTELEVTSLEIHLQKIYNKVPGTSSNGLEEEFKVSLAPALVCSARAGAAGSLVCLVFLCWPQKALPAFLSSSAEADFDQDSERQDEDGQSAGKHEEEQGASDNSM